MSENNQIQLFQGQQVRYLLKAEGSEVYEKIVQLKLPAPDGKMRLTDVATTEQLFRLIQSVPSQKAEPFKLWERLEEQSDEVPRLSPLASNLSPNRRFCR